MDSVCSDMTFTMPGFPIRKPSVQSLLDSSPKIIAAYRVLHRSLVPRHPPYALNSLNICSSVLKAKSKSITINNFLFAEFCRIVSFKFARCLNTFLTSCNHIRLMTNRDHNLLINCMVFGLNLCIQLSENSTSKSVSA